jgi:hypothetical protein
MDPLTLALIGAGLFAAVRIKRAATPSPQPQAEEAPEPEPISFGGFPPHAFGDGRGLRPPVTHLEVSKERNIEGDTEGGRGRERAGEEPANVAPLGAGFGPRAQEALASGPPADVVGASRTYSPSGSTDTRPSVGTSGTRPYGTFGPISGTFAKRSR